MDKSDVARNDGREYWLPQVAATCLVKRDIFDTKLRKENGECPHLRLFRQGRPCLNVGCDALCFLQPFDEFYVLGDVTCDFMAFQYCVFSACNMQHSRKSTRFSAEPGARHGVDI